MLKKIGLLCALGTLHLSTLVAQNVIVDQVVWVVGDEAILQSEIENEIVRLTYEKEPVPENPQCVIAEQIALQKLFIAQAKLDSITVPESSINQQTDSRINYFIEYLGSKEKVESYFKKSIPKVREELKRMLGDQLLAQEIQQTITKNIKITPAEVRAFYQSIPADSLPIVPEQVEVQIITLTPTVSVAEVERVKSRLREFRERIESGEIQFSTLAILYSEDRASGLQGGEIGFRSRSMLVPEFANVAFALNDPTKVSRIVESEFGYHIIQFIDKKDDQLNCRHILMRPKVSIEEQAIATGKLDSITEDTRKGTLRFDEAVASISDKSATKHSQGLMINANTGSIKFQVSELPQEIATQVARLRVGEISSPFSYTAENGKEVTAIIRLQAKTLQHKANIEDDYQELKTAYTNLKNAQTLQTWIIDKIANTYNYITPEFRECDFAYPNWIHTK